MYYLNSRYYNPQTGRFINADGMLGQLGDIQSTNMYAYCANNPVMYLDPSGEFSISGLLWNAAASVIGYIAAAVISIWDKEVRKDMNDINWNPFNSDESLVLNSTKLSFYKGQFVIKSNFAFTSHRSFSFGIMFLEQNESKSSPAYGADVVRHEWGHFVQLSIVGVPKFVLFFGIPSMLNGNNPNYFSLPWERSADLFGEVSGSNWENPHTSNSGIYSLLYLLGVLVL